MYNIVVNFRIGDYIKDKQGDVFEIAKVSLDIIFDTETGKERAEVRFAVVNPRESESELKSLSTEEIMRATKEEVDDYILNNKKAYVPKPTQQGTQEDVQRRYLEEQGKVKQTYKPVNKNSSRDYETSEPPVEVPVRERNIDYILDEINDYKNLIKMFGARGKAGQEYKKKIEELKEELKSKA